MVFSSQLFLYGFLPVFFSLYYLIDDRRKNWLILIGSLVFYGVGAGSTVVVLLASIWVNQLLAVRIAPAPQPRRSRLLAFGVTINLLGLAYYKYTGFLWDLASDSLAAFSVSRLGAAPEIALPVGISFFTFQAVSYLIDVYRREIPVAGSYTEFAVYHSLFPQLVAGPIVRYSEIRSEMGSRTINGAALTEGAYRFCLGLGKKLIIADNLGTVADSIFALPAGELGCEHAWIGALCYSLQIYFDFSGYSDMAIGLGRLLGFHFPENFDQPYRSAAVTEFWRRWHMTLSRWFRDYLYIPLGGNRRGTLRTFANLWIVFFLCGLWHGAGLTFVVWGLYHGSLLIVERYVHAGRGWRPVGPVAIALTFVLVTIGWVFFRAPTVDAAGHFLSAMFLLGPELSDYRPITAYLQRDTLAYLALGLFFAFVPMERLYRLRYDQTNLLMVQLGVASMSLMYSLLLLAANSFNPFIYFRF
jgi:alginate O-acetyltransferase complex protein AlgI